MSEWGRANPQSSEGTTDDAYYQSMRHADVQYVLGTSMGCAQTRRREGGANIMTPREISGEKLSKRAQMRAIYVLNSIKC